ncbi:MAG: hypothetical protein V1673_02915 [Candidatus Omnitrophota bacterium]
MKKIMSLVIVLSMILAPVVFAASPWTEEKTYGEKTVGKLGFGLTNTCLGWTKIFTTPNDYSNEGKNAWSGVGQGFIDAVVVTIGGAVQLVTFPIPVDVPLPGNGVDLGGAAKK